MSPKIVIVGAGPSGVRAAEELVQAGLRPVVIDESPRDGGQIYRRPPYAVHRDSKTLYGFEAKRADSVHRAFDRIIDQIDYRANTCVWGIQGKSLNLVSEQGPEEIAYDRLILAVGAMDRVVPFPGWTLPGVYTLGGAQIALKYQACAIGEQPVFVGTGPLLYLAAYQYLKAGVRVAAVLDTSETMSKWRALPGLLSGGTTFLKGLFYVASLYLGGVRLASGISPKQLSEAAGNAMPEFSWVGADGSHQKTECDAMAIGFGLRSETQLADLCGASFVFDSVQRQWLPEQDKDGRAVGAEGVYLAGDGAAVKGADLAEVSGKRAAHALLFDLGFNASGDNLKTLNRSLCKAERFRRALDGDAFAFPAKLAAKIVDSVVICRCEGITAGELRQSVIGLGACEVNRAKAFSRVGMGRCQGRICGSTAAEVLADSLDVPIERVGRLRGQAPVKPLPLTNFLEKVPS